MSQMLLIRCDDESVFSSYIETSQPAPGGCRLALDCRLRAPCVPAFTFNLLIKVNSSLKLRHDFPALRCATAAPRQTAVAAAYTGPKQMRRTRVCVKSFLRWHCFALWRRAQKQEPSIISAAIIPTGTLGIRQHGAGGTCVVRWAAIQARSTTSPKRGLTMAQMPVVRPLALSSSGDTTSAKLLATRMVNG